jgi:hypothetical protein
MKPYPLELTFDAVLQRVLIEWPKKITFGEISYYVLDPQFYSIPALDAVEDKIGKKLEKDYYYTLLIEMHASIHREFERLGRLKAFASKEDLDYRRIKHSFDSVLPNYYTGTSKDYDLGYTQNDIDYVRAYMKNPVNGLTHKLP